MTQAEAASGIRIMAAIAADWRRISALYAGRATPARDESATREEKREALAGAVHRLEATSQRARAALPAVLPSATGATRAEVNCSGFSIEDLIRAANDRCVAADVIRPVARALERLHLGQALLWHASSPLGPMFYAELTAELRTRCPVDRAA
ncbi:hypothetical protein [Sphingomonas nostoxanthinifaciens]|uniref:hypothetical protein n=1 Tax=Sphingomonas nostoxanthinifaciens TaxID=2872652 RepID=UPI001CC217BA|nr:hypothetical protein [Sphingomonas nostoxanthinifaciens]UAK24211.1 hypothetical protein K8P63_18070 [Sphingomonas nostoxanthinifaciens]